MDGKFSCNRGLFRGVQLKMICFCFLGYCYCNLILKHMEWQSCYPSSLHSMVTFVLSLCARNCAIPPLHSIVTTVPTTGSFGVFFVINKHQ